MKAMLACSESITKAMLPGLKYPLFASPKYDGIRALSIGQQPISRHAKLLPNRDLQYAFKHMPPVDGEVLVPGDFNKVQSAIMSQNTCVADKFSYFVFDTTELDWHTKRFDARLTRVEELAKNAPPQVQIAPLRLCNSPAEVIAFYEEVLAYDHPWDYDGLILRSQSAPYKYGRSTLKQEWMLKMKPWDDAEGVIVGFEELMRNLDTSCKRKENMVPGGMLGKFVVQWNGQEFNVGGGKNLTVERRLHYWNNQAMYLGKKLTFKHLGLSEYGVPRHPNYKGIRLEE